MDDSGKTTKTLKRATAPARRSVNATVTLVMACVASLVLVSFLVVTSSRAAFTATTDNSVNSISTGGLSLTDNDATTAMFSYTGVYPGWTQDKCIKVDYSSTLLAGTQPGAVKLYLSTIGWVAPAAATTAAGNVTVQIDQSTTGSSTFGDCTGFSGTPTVVLASTTLGSLTTATYTTGTSYSQWTPAGTASETRYYRFRMTLPAGATNITTASTGNFGFTWETQK
jgi:hypothetical protein